MRRPRRGRLRPGLVLDRPARWHAWRATAGRDLRRAMRQWCGRNAIPRGLAGRVRPKAQTGGVSDSTPFPGSRSSSRQLLVLPVEAFADPAVTDEAAILPAVGNTF